MNREMLKEAIAEAKTIKETAIANAKAALEEAFTPQLTAMFAEKLNEEELEEEYDENTTDESLNELEETFNLDEILAELEMTDEADEMVSEEDTTEGIDEDLMLEEMSDEEIEELVMKVIDDMIETGKLMPGEGEEEEDIEDVEDMDDMEDMKDMGGEEVEDEEEVELDELLNELLGEEKVEEGILDKITSFFGSVLGDFERENKDVISKFQNSAKTTEDKKEIIDALTAWGRKNQIEGPYIQAARTAASEKYDLGLKGGATTAQMGTFEEAQEMEETINELRNELNEVNLLNAKLLYTNKIFKAKNLTESEKVKVLNTFDKAETVKEVKLVFETLTESFKAVAKKTAIKESLGSASRSIAPAQTKQPIIEVNDAFARMQRLAGIKK
jgi:hypothetical protein